MIISMKKIVFLVVLILLLTTLYSADNTNLQMSVDIDASSYIKFTTDKEGTTEFEKNQATFDSEGRLSAYAWLVTNSTNKVSVRLKTQPLQGVNNPTSSLNFSVYVFDGDNFGSPSLVANWASVFKDTPAIVINETSTPTGGRVIGPKLIYLMLYNKEEALADSYLSNITLIVEGA